MSIKLRLALLLAGSLLLYGCGGGGPPPAPDEAKAAEKPVTLSADAAAMVDLAATAPQVKEAGDNLAITVTFKAKADLNWQAINVEGRVKGGPPSSNLIVAQAKGPVTKGQDFSVTFTVRRSGTGERVVDVYAVHEGRPWDLRPAFMGRGGGGPGGGPPGPPR